MTNTTGPMWVLFWMTDDETDHFSICADEQEARDRYGMLIVNDIDVRCAGIAPINESTEPWHVRSS
jgi:hypothetical protein